MIPCTCENNFYKQDICILDWTIFHFKIWYFLQSGKIVVVYCEDQFSWRSPEWNIMMFSSLNRARQNSGSLLPENMIKSCQLTQLLRKHNSTGGKIPEISRSRSAFVTVIEIIANIISLARPESSSPELRKSGSWKFDSVIGMAATCKPNWKSEKLLWNIP